MHDYLLQFIHFFTTKSSSSLVSPMTLSSFFCDAKRKNLNYILTHFLFSKIWKMLNITFFNFWMFFQISKNYEKYCIAAKKKIDSLNKGGSTILKIFYICGFWFWPFFKLSTVSSSRASAETYTPFPVFRRMAKVYKITKPILMLNECFPYFPHTSGKYRKI